MPVLVLANEATAGRRRVYFHCVDATDGITAETGEAGGQPEISTNGGAWTSTGIGTLSAIGNGRYYADLTQVAVATAGDAIETRYKSVNTAETPGDSVRVVAFDPYDAASLGLSNVTAIVADTNELQTDWADGGRLDVILDARSSQVSVDTIDTIVDAILVDTAEIGVAGAGLTEAGGTGDHLTDIPWNSTDWDTPVETAVIAGLTTYDAATGSDVTAVPKTILVSSIPDVPAGAATVRLLIKSMDENLDPVDLDAVPSVTITKADGTAAAATVGVVVQEAGTGNYYAPITVSTAESLIGTISGTRAVSGTHVIPFAFDVYTATGGGDATAANQATIIGLLGSPSDLGSGANVSDNLVDIFGGLSAGCTGSGAWIVQVTVTDGVNPLENANVRFTEGVNTYVGQTDVAGEVTFNLDSATYTVGIYKPGYSFAGTTEVISADATPTYVMTAISIPAPPTPDTTMGYATVFDTAFAPAVGVIVRYRMIETPDGDAGAIHDRNFAISTSDGAGLVTMALLKGATYEFFVDGHLGLKVVIPAGAGATYELGSFVVDQ